MDQLQFFSVFASLGRQILRSESNADLLKKRSGRLAASKDPHVIVCDSLHRAFHFEDDRIGSEFYRIGVENDCELSFARRLLQAPRVPLFDSAKGRLTI